MPTKTTREIAGCCPALNVGHILRKREQCNESPVPKHPTVARENFARFKFRIFCNFAWHCWSTLLNPSPSPTLTVPCQASWSQRRSIVPTERCLPCSLLPVPLARRMTDPGNDRAAHIWSLPLSRRLRSLDMRLSQGISGRSWNILSSGASTWRRVPSGRGRSTRKDCGAAADQSAARSKTRTTTAAWRQTGHSSAGLRGEHTKTRRHCKHCHRCRRRWSHYCRP